MLWKQPGEASDLGVRPSAVGWGWLEVAMEIGPGGLGPRTDPPQRPDEAQGLLVTMATVPEGTLGGH